MPCPQPEPSATTQEASIRGFSAMDKQGNSTLIVFFLAAQGLSCGIWDLVPRPGIKPRPPALGTQS